LRFVAAALVGLMLAAFALFILRRRRVAEALGDSGIMRHLLGLDLAAIPWKRLIPIGLATIAIALAMTDPALEARPSVSRGPLVLILDASGSMLVDDVGPRRLDLQREIAEQLVAALPDVPIGIVAFAGRAFSLTPPTRDRGSVDMYLETLDPTIVTQTGSALGAAIRQGISLLAASDDAAGGTIVLFGDGDETENVDAAREAAQLARRNAVTIHVVGLGTREGGPVPSLDLTTGVTDGFLENPDRSVRISQLDDDLLSDIASDSRGGRYLSGSDPQVAETLAELIRVTETGPDVSTDALPRYAWFAGAAILLLLIEPVTDNRRRG
jgi:Ca-activated chloride channel family protein